MPEGPPGRDAEGVAGEEAGLLDGAASPVPLGGGEGGGAAGGEGGAQRMSAGGWQQQSPGHVALHRGRQPVDLLAVGFVLSFGFQSPPRASLRGELFGISE